MSETSFDPYHRWLGIPKEEQPPNHYRLLGIVLFEQDADVIRDAAERQISYVRRHASGEHKEVANKILNQLAKAEVVLTKPDSKSKYDSELSEKAKSEKAITEKAGAEVDSKADRSEPDSEVNDAAQEATERPALVNPAPLHDPTNQSNRTTPPPPPQKTNVPPLPQHNPEVAEAPRLENPAPMAVVEPDFAPGANTNSPPQLKSAATPIVQTEIPRDIPVKPMTTIKPRSEGASVGWILALLGSIAFLLFAIFLAVGLIFYFVSDSKEVNNSNSVKKGTLPKNSSNSKIVFRKKSPSKKNSPNINVKVKGNAVRKTSGSTTIENPFKPIGSKKNRQKPTSNEIDDRERKSRQRQVDFAEKNGLPIKWTSASGIRFVLIPPGEFKMGADRNDPLAERNEFPQHLVEISQPFYISENEISRKEYRQATGRSTFGSSRGPVEGVTAEQAINFCDTLRAIEKESAFRLPTESEWEYACRADDSFIFTSDDSELSRYARVDSSSPSSSTRKPNAWGLQNMLGNVAEWCSDYLATYPDALQIDPQGPNSGSHRVVRGGNYRTKKISPTRRETSVQLNSRGIGLRIAFTADAAFKNNYDLKAITKKAKFYNEFAPSKSDLWDLSKRVRIRSNSSSRTIKSMFGETGDASLGSDRSSAIFESRLPSKQYVEWYVEKPVTLRSFALFLRETTSTFSGSRLRIPGPNDTQTNACKSFALFAKMESSDNFKQIYAFSPAYPYRKTLAPPDGDGQINRLGRSLAIWANVKPIRAKYFRAEFEPHFGGVRVVELDGFDKFNLGITKVASKIPSDSSAKKGEPAKTFKNGLEMEFALIPAGTFVMGETKTRDEIAEMFGIKSYKVPRDSTAHEVKISQQFYMGKHEVTVGQFAEFIKDAKYRTDGEKNGAFGWDRTSSEIKKSLTFNWKEVGFRRTDNHPVTNVSWNDAIAFCDWISEKENKLYRLPTEAEWEYACRAGTRSLYYFGDNYRNLTRYGNVLDSTAKLKFRKTNVGYVPGSDKHAFTAEVGRFAANKFGLFDMHGNVTEWCSDFYSRSYFSTAAMQDPKGPRTGFDRVGRGGAWDTEAVMSRCCSRAGAKPDFCALNTGFRLVVEIE